MLYSMLHKTHLTSVLTRGRVTLCSMKAYSTQCKDLIIPQAVRYKILLHDKESKTIETNYLMCSKKKMFYLIIEETVCLGQRYTATKKVSVP